jgi:hypothetical protein
VLGLRDALEQGAEIEADVAALMREGIAKFGDVERFPYSAIMRAVAHYEPRRRRDR